MYGKEDDLVDYNEDELVDYNDPEFITNGKPLEILIARAREKRRQKEP